MQGIWEESTYLEASWAMGLSIEGGRQRARFGRSRHSQATVVVSRRGIVCAVGLEGDRGRDLAGVERTQIEDA